MGPLFYHTSHVPGLIFWLRANVIANVVRVRVADRELAAHDLLELLDDYQVVSGWLTIVVSRIFATFLSLRRDPRACA